MNRPKLVVLLTRTSITVPVIAITAAFALVMLTVPAKVLIGSGIALAGLLLAAACFGALALVLIRKEADHPRRNQILFGLAINVVFLVALVGAFIPNYRARKQRAAEVTEAQAHAADSYLQYDGWLGGDAFDWGDIVVANIPEESPFYQELLHTGIPPVKVFIIRAQNSHGLSDLVIDPSSASFELDGDGDHPQMEQGMTTAEILAMMPPEAAERWRGPLTGPYRTQPGGTILGAFAFARPSLPMGHVTGIRMPINEQNETLSGELLSSLDKQRLADAEADAGREDAEIVGLHQGDPADAGPH